MKKELLIGIGGFILGVAITLLITMVRVSNDTKIKNDNLQVSMMEKTNEGQKNTSHSKMEETMEDMMGGINDKTGDAFDKAFLEEMIQHHDGAIEMAKAAKERAKHDEVKAMAENIISAQSSEILQMQQWQQEWGYKE